MYPQDKIDIALQVYHQYGRITNTICMLGYPAKRVLYTWIKDRGVRKPPRKTLDNTNTVAHSHPPLVEVKMNVIHHCSELGEGIKYVSEKTGYSRVGIYAWRKEYLQGDTVTLVDDKNVKPGTLTEGTRNSP